MKFDLLRLQRDIESGVAKIAARKIKSGSISVMLFLLQEGNLRASLPHSRAQLLERDSPLGMNAFAWKDNQHFRKV